MRASLHRVSATYAGRCKLTPRPCALGDHHGSTWKKIWKPGKQSLVLVVSVGFERYPACAILSPGPCNWQRRFAASVEELWIFSRFLNLICQ